MGLENIKGRINDLEKLGQAIWLDFIDRKFLAEGGLKKLVEEDGVTGVTSNPSIFEKAMGHGNAYDTELAEFDRANPGASAMERYEHLAIQDIQAAADTLRPVYDRLNGKDGYVSLEVSPYLANDTDETAAEAERLWTAVNRPNLMVKIPGTPAGVPAIASAIDKGVNINVTLLFSIEAYKAVALAFDTLPPARRTRLDTHRRWGWWALTDGNVRTARKYALHALREAPLDRESWKLMACALRGH